MSHIVSIGNILTNIGEFVEGNLICDVSPNDFVYEQNVSKIKNLQELVKDKKKVCEIGVNAGHSLLIMLEKNSDAEYYLFDLGHHKYTKPCLEYIKQLYPNTKIEIFYGDSKETLEKFIINNPENLKTFDLIHIDGGHEELEYTNDFYYSRLLSMVGGISVFDDYDYETIKAFLDIRLENKIIKHYESETVLMNNKQLIYTQ